MKKNKLERIKNILICPQCGKINLKYTNNIVCASCKNVYSYNEMSYNFLNAEIIEYGKVRKTANISAHNYDSVALDIITKHANGLVLDNGCGLRNTYYNNVVNFEIVDYPTTDVLGIGERLPFKDNSFDALFSLNVLEHIRKPFESSAEMLRVLKPGGELYVVAPFL